MYNTECPPPGTPLDPTPGSVGSRGLLPKKTVVVFFSFATPQMDLRNLEEFSGKHG